MAPFLLELVRPSNPLSVRLRRPPKPDKRRATLGLDSNLGFTGRRTDTVNRRAQVLLHPRGQVQVIALLNDLQQAVGYPNACGLEQPTYKALFPGGTEVPALLAVGPRICSQQ